MWNKRRLKYPVYFSENDIMKMTEEALIVIKMRLPEFVFKTNSQWRHQGGGGRGGGQMPPQNYFLPPHFAPPQFLIISVETISRWEPWEP